MATAIWTYWAPCVERAVVWYENRGSANTVSWEKHYIDDKSLCPAHGNPADMDGDGDLDVVMALGFYFRPDSDDPHASHKREDNQVVWYENDGTPSAGVWKKHIIQVGFEDAFEAVAGDLDGDGDLDVVATSWWNPGRVAWFENQGDARGKWTKHILKDNWRSVNQVIIAEDDSPEEDDSQPAKPDPITHVAVDKLTMHDQDALKPALDDADQRGVKPQELLADSHYGSNECLEKGRKRGVERVSPSMPAKGTRPGKLTLEDFELEEQGSVVRCPTGQSPVEARVAEVRLQVLFDPGVCAGCPRQSDCPAAAVGRRERRWQDTHDRVRQRARRLEDASDAFRDRYRWRAGVEATRSRFKHQMGMARLRVRGMAKVTYVAMLRALGLNLHRVAAYRTAVG